MATYCICCLYNRRYDHTSHGLSYTPASIASPPKHSFIGEGVEALGVMRRPGELHGAVGKARQIYGEIEQSGKLRRVLGKARGRGDGSALGPNHTLATTTDHDSKLTN